MLQLNLDQLINFRIHDDCEHCGSLCDTVICPSCHESLKAGFSETLADQTLLATAVRSEGTPGDSFVASNDDVEQKGVVNY